MVSNPEAIRAKETGSCSARADIEQTGAILQAALSSVRKNPSHSPLVSY